MKQFSIVRSACILLLSYFLLPCALFAQDTYSTFEKGNILALKSNGYYIIDDNGTLSGVQNNLSINALWTVDNNWKLKNLSTGSYMLYNNGYSLTATQSDATSVENFIYQYLKVWYIGQTGNDGYYRYYRPSISVNENVSISSENQDFWGLRNFKTQAIKITTKNFKREEIVEGGKVYGSETTNVTEGTKSFSIAYTGGSCDLSGVVAIVKTKPYSQTTTTTTYSDDYYVSSDESIKVLKQSNVDTENSSTITGEETETLQPTSFNITPNGTTIDGYSIKGTSVILPLNTTRQQRTAKFNVTLRIDGQEYTRTVTITQAANTSGTTYRTFTHKVGQANSALNAKGLQQVHTSEQVVYALGGEEKHLKLQVSSNAGNYIQGFHRWFNYDNDATVNSGLRHAGADYNYTANAKGVYIYGSDSHSGETYYKMQGNNAIKIACDVAQYGDYNVTNTSIVEPTLSYRMVYDIRPASEMAAMLDECTSDPLETYNILAPAGKTVRFGPQYCWYGGANYVNYYYTSGGNVERLDRYQWYRNNTAFSVGTPADNRLIEVTAPAAGQTAVYELRTTTGLIIARFNITSQAASSIGPSTTTIKSNTELDKAYDLKAFRNFDFADGTSNMYSKPLPWDESTYGFTYSTGVAGSNKLRAPGFPDWSEYALIKNTNEYTNGRNWVIGNVRDHSNNGNGYFLYIDANEVSGKIADLKIDGDLCPNTSIWVSAWFVGIGNSNHPNLNFIVTGIDASGNESQILTYTTGATDNRGTWQQVLFEVKLDEREFAQYRLRIDNNGATATGNDFGIDDIRIYTSKPAVMGIQAMNACAADESTNTAILRVDFNRPGVMSNSHMAEKVYYRWMDNNTSNPLSLDYVGNNSAYGEVSVSTEWGDANQITNAGKKFYSSLNDFLTQATVPAEGFVEFYTIETVTYEDGTTKTHPVLYVVHNSAKFKVNQKYEAQIMPYEPDFAKAQCATKYVFDVRPRSRILVNGVEQNTTLLQNLDLGTYPLSVRAFGNNSSTGGFESIDCLADWLTITNDMSDNQKTTYINELLAFREDYPSAGADKLSAYSNLKSLYDAGHLTLGVSSMAATLSKRGVPVTYVAVPLESSSNDKFTICPNPLEVVLRAEVFIVLTNPEAPAYEEMPLAIQGSPCVIRIPESSDEQQLPDIEMKVNYINREILGLLTQDQQDNLFNIVLCETNDDVYQSQASNHSLHVFNLKPSNASKTHVSQLEIDDRLYAQLVDEDFKMKPGKYYKFHSVTEIINGTSLTPAFNFDIYVVPNVVVWNPSLQNSAWHNDVNWKTTDGQPAFIPLEGTDVIIKGNSRCDVVLPEDPTEALGAGANQYLKYEIGVDYSSCKNIYFEAGAKLGRQHKLNYTSAYVDVAFDKSGEGNWEMISVPLKDVARGDFYIPKAGDGDFGFSDAVAVDNRAYNAFYMKAYNSNVKQTIVNDGKVGTEDYTYESAAWSDAISALNFKLEEAHGYAINRICTTQQDFVRLPKTATEYYLFYDLGNGTEMELVADWAKYGDISRNNSHKLVYDQSSANKEFEFVNQQGDIFLIGNPFMTNLNVSEFFRINGLATTDNCFYYEYVDGELVVNKLIIPSNQALRPLHAMFVKNLSGETSMNIKFTPEMMLFNESAEVEVPNKVLAKAREKEYISSLKILAQVGEFKSSTRIEEVYDASNFYSTTEDAELLVLDADLTPISLYSVVGNTALAYNKVSNIDMIPISLLLSDTTLISETFNLTFEGVDNFDEELYLYDTIYNTEMPLIEGLSIDLEMIESGEVRYYIRAKESNGGTITDTENIFNNLACVTTGKNVINVFCNETINAVELFDVSGRCIYIKTLCDDKHQIFVPAGIYMLQLNINGCVENHKVVVK